MTIGPSFDLADGIGDDSGCDSAKFCLSTVRRDRHERAGAMMLATR